MADKLMVTLVTKDTVIATAWPGSTRRYLSGNRSRTSKGATVFDPATAGIDAVTFQIARASAVPMADAVRRLQYGSGKDILSLDDSPGPVFAVARRKVAVTVTIFAAAEAATPALKVSLFKIANGPLPCAPLKKSTFVALAPLPETAAA